MPLTLTFNDVLLRPGYADFDRSDIRLKTQLTKRIALETPIVSAPMDTVTESRLAIALAKMGGIGIIHRNLTIDRQVAEIQKVKRANLMVGAAVGSSAGYEARMKRLVEGGVDVLVIDSAHGHTRKVVAALEYVKQHFDIDVIAGNVATAEGAQALIDAGADGLRVGMGPGAICSTRIISGMGVPQLSALFETTAVARKHGVPVIADGGLMYSGDVVKALAAGTSSVMFGRLLAATVESPAKIVMLPPGRVPGRFQSILNGAPEYAFKEYRGMGSVAAMQQGLRISSEDEFHGKNYQDNVLVAEGVEGLVPCSGTVSQLVEQMMGGMRSGLYYVGALTIPELWQAAQFMRITSASLSESHPHDLFITNAGENYQ